MFRASLCPSSGEQDVCYCMWCAALVLLDVVGSGCGALSCGCEHNRYQPHPAEPAQHTTCSNIRLVLLKMGIMMPETCWDIVKNKHLTVASCWFSLSLHNLLTMHGHRNLKHPHSSIWLCIMQLGKWDETLKAKQILVRKFRQWYSSQNNITSLFVRNRP